MPVFTTTRNYQDNTVLTEAQLDAAFDSLETFLNSTKLDSQNLQTNSVDSSQIVANAVTSGKIAANAVDETKLATAVQEKLVPAGVVMATFRSTAPTGWLLCDGSAVSRVTYSTLFAAIGEACGEGDNATTFNLPDLRGRFLRGVDSGQARDPDAASRTAMATGGNTGDNVGSVQLDAFQGHKVSLDSTTHGSVAGGGNLPPGFSGSGGASFNRDSSIIAGSNGTPRTSDETRPKNANVLWIIKT